MAPRHRNGPRPGHRDFIPLTDPERRAHADSLTQAHAGHDCDLQAQSLCQAAEYYSILGEHDTAEQRFRDALDIDDAEPGTVHAYYAAFLLDQTRDQEAFEIITAARKLNPEEPDVFNVIGEALLDHGHPQQAARWFTTGLVHQLGHLTDLHVDDLRHDLDLAQLAQGRYQARQAIGLPHDHVDELVKELQPRKRVQPSSINRSRSPNLMQNRIT